MSTSSSFRPVMPPLAALVPVYNLDNARAALAAGAVGLRSAPGVAGYAGVAYVRALSDALGVEVWCDCDDDAGLVLAALRAGCRAVVFAGDDEVAGKLAAIARQRDAVLYRDGAVAV